MQGLIPLHHPTGERRLPSAVTDFTITRKKIQILLYVETLPTNRYLTHPKYMFPRVVISGHTIFEVSTRNQTPTNLNASAMKTRMKKLVLSLLASSCLPARLRRCIVDNALLNSVHTLRALNQRVPHLSGATNCHGRTQFLPCWLCSCGPLSQACPSR